MPDLIVAVLGFPQVTAAGRKVDINRRKALALLAYLAVESQPQSRDTLGGLFWPDLNQAGAQAALRTTLPALTHLTSDRLFLAVRGMLALDRAVIRVDVHELRDLLAQARTHQHPGGALCAECLGWLEMAVALYRGPLLDGFSLSRCPEFDLWQTSRQEWVRHEMIDTLRRLVGDPGDRSLAWQKRLIIYARRWLEIDPLAEEAHRMLMRLYAASGMRNEALLQYKACVTLLDTELATPPEEVTTRLAEQIKAGITMVTAPQPVLRPAEVLPPFPTLVVGREPVLADLRARMGVGGQYHPITVIQGWPGVGKSTIVALLARDPQLAAWYPDGVLWASLGAQPGRATILGVWADALGIMSPNRMFTIEEISRQLMATLRERRMLLIIDDVWQIDHAAPFQVAGQYCTTVITSRMNDVAQALAPTPRDIYRLPVLEETDGVKLLELLAPEAVAAYPDEAYQLVRDLEGLPLAIQVAGRLLQNEIHLGWGITELLGELRAGVRLLSSGLPGDMIDPRHDTTPTIAALLQRSTNALDPLSLERFTLLGLFVPKPATFDLAAMAIAWDTADPRMTARLLVNRGLLEPIGAGRFQMHALLVLHARSLMEIT